MLTNLFFAVLLALCVAWPCYAAEDLSITTHEMIFSPKPWDYWYGRKKSEGKLTVKDYRYQILKFGTDGKTLELQRLASPSSTYFVLAVSKISVKDRRPFLQWSATCHRQPKAIGAIRSTPFDVHYIVVDSKDKQIQFQCPNRKKTRINISLKPLKQGKAWTPTKGKIKLLNLRTKPFEGYRLFFPKTIEWDYEPKSKLMKTLILKFLTHFGSLKKTTHNEYGYVVIQDVTERHCGALEFYRNQIGGVYDQEDQWVADCVYLLRRIHPTVLIRCPDSEAMENEWPYVNDFLEGKAHSRFRLSLDPFIPLGTGAKDNIELTELGDYPINGQKVIASCRWDKISPRLFWHCGTGDSLPDMKWMKWIVVPESDYDKFQCRKEDGKLTISVSGKIVASVRDTHPTATIPPRSVSAIEFTKKSLEKGKTCEMWKEWAKDLKSALDFTNMGKVARDYDQCPLTCESIASIMELIGDDRIDNLKSELGTACSDDNRGVLAYVTQELENAREPPLDVGSIYLWCKCGVGQFMDRSNL